MGCVGCAIGARVWTTQRGIVPQKGWSPNYGRPTAVGLLFFAALGLLDADQLAVEVNGHAEAHHA